MNAINREFKVGERYRGLVSGHVFTVVEVRKPGEYTTPSGGMYSLRQQTIVFRDEKTGKAYEHSAMQSQYMKLERIGEDKE